MIGVNIVPTSGISPWLVNATGHQLFGVQLVFYLALAWPLPARRRRPS